MKTFNTPVIEIEKLNIADVIATSGGCGEFEECPTFVCPLD